MGVRKSRLIRNGRREKGKSATTTTAVPPGGGGDRAELKRCLAHRDFAHVGVGVDGPGKRKAASAEWLIRGLETKLRGVQLTHTAGTARDNTRNNSQPA
jgi:hypothetical protein